MAKSDYRPPMQRDFAKAFTRSEIFSQEKLQNLWIGPHSTIQIYDFIYLHFHHRRPCGPVIWTQDLSSGDTVSPSSWSCLSADLTSTPRPHLFMANRSASHQLGILTLLLPCYYDVPCLVRPIYILGGPSPMSSVPNVWSQNELL